MFDVDNKRAVDRLAAVVVMLEQRERTAQQAYDEIRDRIRVNEPTMSTVERTEERISWRCASARWTEAQEALSEARTAARELAPRDL